MKLSVTKVLITVSIYCCVFSNGICSNIYGPTWLDLTSLMNTTLQRMSFSISIRAMFFCAGAMIGGFIYKFVDRGALYPIFILTKGLCVALIPLYASYYAFLAFSSVIGLVSGAADTSVNVWILDIWGDQSAPYVQALQFFWALGFIVSPLISTPFLQQDSRKVDLKNISNILSTSTTASSVGSSSAPYEADALVSSLSEVVTTAQPDVIATSAKQPESLLYVPYGIAGALCLIGSVSLLLIYTYKKVSQWIAHSQHDADKQAELAAKKQQDQNSETEESAELESLIAFTKKRVYKYQVLIYACVMTSVFCASEMTTLQYIPTYCVKLDLGLTKNYASMIMTGVAISFAVGRFVGIFCAIHFKPQNILWFDWLIILIGNVTLLFSNFGLSYLWAGSLLIGFGYASFFAAVFSFLKERIKVNNLISSVVILSSLSGNAFGFPVFIGKYIDTQPLMMIWGNIFCLVIMLVCQIALAVMDCEYGVRSSIVAKHKEMQMTVKNGSQEKPLLVKQ